MHTAAGNVIVDVHTLHTLHWRLHMCDRQTYLRQAVMWIAAAEVIAN